MRIVRDLWRQCWHPEARHAKTPCQSDTDTIERSDRQIKRRNAKQLVIESGSTEPAQKPVECEHENAVTRAKNNFSEVLARRSCRIGHQQMQSQKHRRWNIGIYKVVKTS